MTRAGWLVLWLAACGAKPSMAVDASGVADGSNDALRVDANPGVPGSITITAFNNRGTTGAPAANVPVVFIDVVQTQVVMTGSDGTATATIYPHASVTVIERYPSDSVLETVFDAMPGDALEIGAPELDTTLTTPFTVNFSPIANADEYLIDSPCAYTTVTQSPATIQMMKFCEHDPFDLFLSPFGSGSTPPPLVQSYLAAPYATGGSATMPAAVSLATFTADVTNLPADLRRISFDLAYGYGQDDQDFPPADAVHLEAYGLQISIAQRDLAAVDTSGAIQYINDRPNGALGWSVDMSTTFLAWMAKPSYVQATHTVSIPISKPGNAPDLFELLVDYRTSAADVMEWRLFGPRPGDIVLPALPGELGPLLPDPAQAQLTIEGWATERDTVDGYDDARHKVDAVGVGLSRDGSDERFVRSISPM